MLHDRNSSSPGPLNQWPQIKGPLDLDQVEINPWRPLGQKAKFRVDQCMSAFASNADIVSDALAYAKTSGANADGEVVWFCHFLMKSERYVV
jgi:hypothetical protein